MTDRPMRRFFNKRDIVIIALIAAVCVVALLLPRNDGGYAEITENGEVIALLDLGDDCEYPVGGKYKIVITVKDASAYFSSSDCPDRVCVRTGKLEKAGDIAVCAPAGVAVRITGKASQDAVTY